MADLVVNFNSGEHELTVYYYRTNCFPEGDCFKCGRPGEREDVIVTEIIDRGVNVPKGAFYRRVVAHVQTHLGHGKHVCPEHAHDFMGTYSGSTIPDA